MLYNITIILWDKELIDNLFKKEKFDYVVNLAAQAGDVPATWADINSLIEVIDYRPSTPVKTGIKKFIKWYKKYNDIK